MAVTQLSDLQFGPNWERYTTEAATRLNAFAASGVLVRDPYLDTRHWRHRSWPCKQRLAVR